MTTAERNPEDGTAAPAVGSPLDRRVRAHDPERAAFEVWASANNKHLSREDCWDAWQAARPKRAAVGRLINLAAKLIHPDTMRKLWRLEEDAGRTLGRRALTAALEHADDNLKALAIEVRKATDAL